LAGRDDVELVGVAANHRGPPPEPFAPAIPVWELGLPRPLLYPAWHHLRRPRVSRATGPVDAIWATAVAVPPREAPLVVTVHDLAPLHHPEHHPKRSLGFYRKGFALACAEADRVCCPSQATLEDCVAEGFDRDKLRHVPWGVRPTAVADEAIDALRAQHDLGEAYVLWVGTAEPRKNLAVLLDAFAKVARPGLTLALVGPEGWNEDVAARIGDRTDVRTLGFVADEDLAALYAGASVFCYPSLLEGFGLPVLEALAQGAPVVTSAGTATEELVDGVGAAVDPHDAQAVADGLAAVLDDPAEAERRRVAGRSRAAELTWEATASAMMGVVQELTA
ncbi:MAG TPA: glycosyltransferase family 1 protein, partial [Acidimicrobiales bacterium]|nr:glycosyltransferase family 1 protein [Acidimicrobiales bacterium]